MLNCLILIFPIMSNKRGVYKRLLPDATVPRNAFDVSRVQSMHYSAGMILPCFFHPAIAKSHFKLNRRIFQRTNSVNTAAFPTIDSHLMFYFVPMKSLFSRFEEMKLNIQDVDSTLLSGGTPADGVGFIPSGVPVCALASGAEGVPSIASAIYNGGSYFTDSIGENGQSGACRLLDMANYGNYANYSYITDPAQVNLLKIQAYQKIYMDHFRNSAYESNDPFAYNVDYAYAQNSGLIPETQIRKILTLRYVNYRKDFMQNLYPSLNYVQSLPNGTDWAYPNFIQGNNAGSTALISGEIDGETENDLGQWTDGSSTMGVGNAVSTKTDRLQLTSQGGTAADIYHTHEIFGDADFQAQYLVNAVNPQTIRAMFALDKLLRASAYAPKHMKDQYEARYGIKYPSNPCDSQYIGGFKNDVIINQVISTANTAASGSNLGSIGGMGTSQSGFEKEIEFTAPVDGLIVGVMFSLPRASYDSSFVDAYNLKHVREDFFIPEFMDMGLTPITQREINMNYYKNVTPDQQSDIPIALNRIKGFRPPYEEYKVGIDVNHGLFARNALAYGESANQMSVYVVHSNNQSLIRTSTGSDGVNYSYFKVKPQDLDAIMRAAYDSTDLNTDQFWTWLHISCVVNQNMSVHGQPRLGIL